MRKPPLNPKKLKRTIFNRQLWESTIAIIRYIPRAIIVKKLHGDDFYKPEKLDEFKTRALKAALDRPTQWGTMNHAQIFHHLNLAFGSALGYFDLPDESYGFGRTFVNRLPVS